MTGFQLWPALLGFPLLLLVYALTRVRKEKSVVFTGPFGGIEGGGASSGTATFVIWCGMLCLFIALARPQYGYERLPDATEGLDIVITLDVSTSMLAEDFRPTRLAAAKAAALEFIAGRPNDRIGLTIYAAEPLVICPPTFDHETLCRFVERAAIGHLQDGTAIGAGLAAAARGLGGSATTRRVIVLLSDGMETAGRVDPITVANAVHTLHGDSIAVYTVAIGTEQDAYGVDRETLASIAAINNGRLFDAYSSTDLSEVYDSIDSLEASTLPPEGLFIYIDRYLGWFWAGLILLLFGMFLKWRALKTIGGGE